jgi:uncharacterized protein YqeY
MTFVEQLKKDLITAMKAKDTETRDNIRALVAEFERQTKKDFSEDEIVKLVKSSIKMEKEKMESVGDTTSSYLTFLETFMPQQASEDDIKAWVAENINFDDFKNKMQAMGPVMKHFGNTVDGKMVKTILGSM